MRGGIIEGGQWIVLGTVASTGHDAPTDLPSRGMGGVIVVDRWRWHYDNGP